MSCAAHPDLCILPRRGYNTRGHTKCRAEREGHQEMPRENDYVPTMESRQPGSANSTTDTGLVECT